MSCTPPPTDFDDSFAQNRDETSTCDSVVKANIQRYSRSELYLIRLDGRSRRRPEVFLRSELLALGIWKVIGGTGTYQQNGNEAPNNQTANNNQSTHISRGQRSPSTRSILSTIESPVYAPNVHSSQKNYIEHRSVSSAHLMPAFAKRRIGVSTHAASSYTTGGSAATGKHETPSESGCVPGDYDGDRSERIEIGSPPVLSSPLQNRPNISNMTNERRIGSGRLLHCEVNWEYRGSDKDNRNISSDKDSSSNQHQQQLQQRNSSRFVDRGSDHPSYIERRSFDRRITDIDKFEIRNNLNTGNSRRFQQQQDNENNSNTTSDHPIQQHTRNRRHHYNDRNDEPEWFSGGPTSQHDTIELRGFDEVEDHHESTTNNSRRKLNESPSSRTSSTLNLLNLKARDLKVSIELDDKECNTNIDKKETSPTISNSEEKYELHNRSDKNNNDGQQQFELDDTLTDNKIKSENNENTNNIANNSSLPEFNFDAFLNMDPLNHSLMGADMTPNLDLGAIGNSRFSRWFVNKISRPDTQKHALSRHLPDESKSNDTCDSNDGNESATPIMLNESQNSKQTNTLMEFLHNSGIPSAGWDAAQPHLGGIPSVEELEARMRKNRSVDITSELSGIEHNQTNIHQHICDITNIAQQQVVTSIESTGPSTAQDTEAFKKLLDQLGAANKQHDHQSNRNVTLQHPQSEPNLMQNVHSLSMLQQHEIANPVPHIRNQDIIKFFHQQRQNPHPAQQPLNEPSQVLAPQIKPGFSGQKRVEALLQGLSRGEVKIAVLQQELNNANTTPYAKEIIAAVLNCVTTSNSQNVTHISGSPHLQMPHSAKTSGSVKQSPTQQQTLKNHGILTQSSQIASAVMLPQQAPPGSHQQVHTTGIPSPRDLHFHTQNIMQNALMKKKLEEQETFLRRQEMQKHQVLPNAMMHGMQHPLEMEISQKTVHQHQFKVSSTTLPIQSPQTLQTSSQQQQSQTQNSQQNLQRHINSPTPLAFTPTSVLRKMTAEKDTSLIPSSQQASIQMQNSASVTAPRQQSHQLGNNTMLLSQQQLPQSHQQPPVLNSNLAPQTHTQQPRMILGGGNHPQQQQIQLCNGGQQISTQQQLLQQQNSTGVHVPQQSQKNRNNPQLKWPVPPGLNQQQIPVNKPIGRPILKGPLPSAQVQKPPQQQQITPISFVSKIEFQQLQQQQKLKMNPALQHLQQQQQFPMTQQQSTQTNIMTNVQQHLFQQQQRAAALQRAQHLQLQINQQQSPQISRIGGILGSNQPLPDKGAPGPVGGIINYQRDGGLSPTSNQLAQWFSPELLAQASAGKLPLLNINQALSLEEFERSIQHSSTPVLN